MSRTPTLRMLAAVLSVVASLSLFHASAYAQDQCVCRAPEVTTRITICFNGSSRQVDVTYCNETFCPAASISDVCSPSAPVDVRTLIRKITPLGFTTTDAQGLVNATIAAVGFCCGNQAGLFNCVSSTTQFVWLVRWSKCATFTGATLELVESGLCCGYVVRYRPNTPTAGLCETAILDNCTVAGLCPPVVIGAPPIVQLECNPFPSVCCW